MAVRLTQAMVERASREEKPGTQLYDADVSGLRVVVGKTSSSYKLVGRINDGTDRYVSIIVGRIDELSLKKARTHATELRLALRRGEDPRKSRTFDYAPHAMRHIYRTFALEAGVDFQTISLLMNQSLSHVSFRYVTKAHLVGHMREAQEAICTAVVNADLKLTPSAGWSPK